MPVQRMSAVEEDRGIAVRFSMNAGRGFPKRFVQLLVLLAPERLAGHRHHGGERVLDPVGQLFGEELVPLDGFSPALMSRVKQPTDKFSKMVPRDRKRKETTRCEAVEGAGQSRHPRRRFWRIPTPATVLLCGRHETDGCRPGMNCSTHGRQVRQRDNLCSGGSGAALLSAEAPHCCRARGRARAADTTDTGAQYISAGRAAATRHGERSIAAGRPPSGPARAPR